MIVKRFHTIGTVATWKEVDIPREIILEKDSRASGGKLGIDRILISKIKGGTRDGDFRLVLIEDCDGRNGGGLMGDNLDLLASDMGIKGGFPCIGYNEQLGGDVYYLNLEELVVVWVRYKHEIVGRPSVSALASTARSENLAKARAVRLERKKYLRNHFR